jgi:hypothetical protein
MLDRFEQAAMAISFVAFAYGVLFGLKVAVLRFIELLVG